MKTRTHVQKPSLFTSNVPNEQEESDKASNIAFYFLMTTLVLGLVYFIVLAFELAL